MLIHKKTGEKIPIHAENIDSVTIEKNIHDSIIYFEQKYPTVKIQNQTWLTKNLNYTPPGKDKNGARCYKDSLEYCATFGQFYNWVTAMNLPDSCETQNCNNLIQTPHQGICPVGWHIPTENDWKLLRNAMGGYRYAGYNLKSKDPIWNGINKFDFNLLPTGIHTPDIDFVRKGEYASFISSDIIVQNSTILVRTMDFTMYDHASVDNWGLKIGRPLRCIKND